MLLRSLIRDEKFLQNMPPGFTAELISIKEPIPLRIKSMVDDYYHFDFRIFVIENNEYLKANIRNERMTSRRLPAGESREYHNEVALDFVRRYPQFKPIISHVKIMDENFNEIENMSIDQYLAEGFYDESDWELVHQLAIGKITLEEYLKNSKKEFNAKNTNLNQISIKKLKDSNFKSSINEILENHKEDVLVTIKVDRFNNENLFKRGSIFNIVKEPDNPYDSEAIAVKYDDETIAYVANSINTVVKGTMSAGRIYDKFNNDDEIEIIFVGNQIIAKLIS